MNIKPFQYDTNLVQTEIIIGALIGIAFIVVAFMLNSRRKKQGKNNTFTPILVLMLGFFSLMGGMVAHGMENDNARKDHYANFHSQLEDKGFTIVSGTPNLFVNAQSKLLLSYEGQNFDCTLFAPKDVTQNIVFSCGEAKLSLDDIKEAK